MSEIVFSIGVSNLCVSAVLAVAAWLAQSRWKRPALAHLLWLGVLVKLLTPPLFTVPLVELPGEATAQVSPLADAEPAALGEALWVVPSDLALDLPAPEAAPAADVSVSPRRLVVALLALGSLVVLLVSLVRVARFHRRLGRASRPAPADVQDLCDELAPQLGLRRAPRVFVTPARLSPMVWWVPSLRAQHRRARIVVPVELTQDRAGLRNILAHELGHVRRRDHLVRWVEWLACVAFWWNPVAWWARRNLRVNEEVCCDALVLSTLRTDPKSYASSLLDAIELVAAPALRPPAVASALNSGGHLERRLTMIVSQKPLAAPSRRAQALFLACTVGLLPLGVAHSQDAEDPAEVKRVAEIERIQLLAVKEQEAANRAASVARVRKLLDDGVISKVEAEKKLAHLDAEAAAAGRAERITQLKLEVARLKELSAEGLASVDEVKARMRELEHLIATEHADLAKTNRDAQMADIKAAYNAGVLSLQEAELKLAAVEEQAAREEVELYRRDLQLAVREVDLAVAQGILSRADAETRLVQLQNEMARLSPSVQQYEAMANELREAVFAGKLTPAQAEARLAELRNAIVAAESRKQKSEAQLVLERIEAGIAAGKVSPEDGKAKLEAYLQTEADRRFVELARERRLTDLDRNAAHLREAVLAGQISKEEALNRQEVLEHEMRKQAVLKHTYDAHQAAHGAAGRTGAPVEIEELKRAQAELDRVTEEGRAAEQAARARLLDLERRLHEKQQAAERERVKAQERERAEAEAQAAHARAQELLQKQRAEEKAARKRLELEQEIEGLLDERGRTKEKAPAKEKPSAGAGR